MVQFQHDPAFIQDPESGYIRIMLLHLPVSLRGLMIAAFAAAYMSTIGTQLNWGASYLVNDVYRRFMIKKQTEKHYVSISQITTVVLMLFSAVISFYMDSIANAWKFLIMLGAGTGLVYILRWFWWRINAWSEVSAMVGAFVTSLLLQFVFKLNGDDAEQFAYVVLITTGVTTVIWLATTWLTKPEPEQVLLSFYRRVRPSAYMWKPIAEKATDIVPQKDGLFNLLNWFLGSVLIYAFLFGVGKIIFGQYAMGILFVAIGVVSFIWIYRNLASKGWETLSQ